MGVACGRCNHGEHVLNPASESDWYSSIREYDPNVHSDSPTLGERLGTRLDPSESNPHNNQYYKIHVTYQSTYSIQGLHEVWYRITLWKRSEY